MGCSFKCYLANLNDWDADLGRVVTAETVVQEYAEQHLPRIRKELSAPTCQVRPRDGGPSR
jgi:hypothetical protein